MTTRVLSIVNIFADFDKEKSQRYFIIVTFLHVNKLNLYLLIKIQLHSRCEI